MNFKIGDRVIVINASLLGEQVHDDVGIIGKTGTVTSLLLHGHCPRSWVRTSGHQVLFDDGRSFIVRFEFLRKIDDDTDGRALVNWGLCPWQPSRSIIDEIAEAARRIKELTHS